MEERGCGLGHGGTSLPVSEMPWSEYTPQPAIIKFMYVFSVSALAGRHFFKFCYFLSKRFSK